LVPGSVRDGATNGVHPMRGSMILVRRASSEALLMAVAVGFAARLAAVSWMVVPSVKRRYCVGTLSEGQAFPSLSTPRGGMTVNPEAIPAFAAVNHG